MKLVLRPIQTDLYYHILEKLANDILTEFEKLKLSLSAYVELNKDTGVQSSINEQRNQWDSFKILECLKKFNPNKSTRILGIFDLDAYSNGFDFVFGEAFYKGRIAAVYMPRLRQEFYGLKPNPSLFYQRLVKEAIHELGHVFGFGHCKNSQCVMYFSTSLFDVDAKRRSFCYTCTKKIIG